MFGINGFTSVMNITILSQQCYLSRHLPRATANVLISQLIASLFGFFVSLFFFFYNFATRSLKVCCIFRILRASHAKSGHLCEYLHRYKFRSTVTGNFGGFFSAFNLNVDSMFGNNSTTAVELNVFCRSSTGCEGKLFQDSNHGDFGLQHGEARANTAPWTGTEWKKGERLDLLFVFFPESKYKNKYTFQTYILSHPRR